MISFALEEDEEMLRATVARLAGEVLRPALREHEKAIPERLRAQLRDLGVFGIDVAEADGGQGGKLVTALIALEELAWGDVGASLALAPSAGYVTLLQSFGTDEQRARYLRPVVAGEAVGALAYCEAPGRPVTVAADGTLSGAKPFVLHAQRARFFAVVAGAAAYVVEAGAGVEVAPTDHLLAFDAALPGRITFANAPAERLGGSGESFTAKLNGALLRAALNNAARQLGLARAAYEFALEYTQDRKAFGKPVAHFQSIAFALAEMAMEIDSARWLAWRAATAPDDHAQLAQAIVHANEVAFRCADDGVQLLGGAGFIRDYPTEKWLRETKALALAGVPSEWCKEVIAAAELGSEVAPPSTWLQPFYT